MPSANDYGKAVIEWVDAETLEPQRRKVCSWPEADSFIRRCLDDITPSVSIIISQEGGE